MMTCLADNPAVTDPRNALTVGERKALLAIRDYRRQLTLPAGVMIGPQKVSRAVIRSLEVKQLVRGDAPHIALTIPGAIAAARLRGTAHV